MLFGHEVVDVLEMAFLRNAISFPHDVGSGLEFENLLRELSPGYWIPAFTANLLASGLVLWFLNRKSLLVLFRISNSVRLRTMVIVVVVTLFLMSRLV